MFIAMSEVFATVSVKGLQPVLPDIALRECIKGKIVYEYTIVDYYAVDMKIISSEPNGYYNHSFINWWNQHVSTMKFPIETLGYTAKSFFDFDPCPETHAPNKAFNQDATKVAPIS